MSSRMMLRNSERQSFKTCRHRWEWTWKTRRQARDAPHALRFGDLIHRSLAPYYKPGRKRGPLPAETYQAIYQDESDRLGKMGFNIWDDEKWTDALPLGVAMLEGYVRNYAPEDEDYEIISSEQTFQVRLRAPILRSGDIVVPAFTFWIVGTFDGVWRHLPTKRVVFKEFKTASAISNDGLAMDEQASTYWTYGPKWLIQQKILLPKQLIREILYTRLRKSAPNPDKTYDADGRVLNLPTKDVLIEEYDRQGRELPTTGTGKNGNVIIKDLIADLGERALLLGEPSAAQPAPYFSRVPVYRDPSDRRRQHERIIAEMRDIYRARMGDPLVPLYKNPGPLHMQNCRGCAVREACEVHEAGGDHQSVLNATTARWEPYAAHELPERN